MVSLVLTGETTLDSDASFLVLYLVSDGCGGSFMTAG